MEINQQCVVALTWTLKDTLGETLDVLDEPVEFLLGGHDLLPKIEAALQGHARGAKLHLQIEPEDAFGDFDAAALAATACMNLCLDHPDRSAEFLRGFYSFLHGKGSDATRHRYVKLAQNFLALVFMYFHESSLSIR